MPGAHEMLERLRLLLREMFQLDRGDLDFGLYRIMNLKAAQVAEFLDNDLLPQVQQSLQLAGNQEHANLEKELEEALADLGRLGVDPEAGHSSKITELNHRLTEIKKDSGTEADVYNHLANFFSRYYVQGDYISQRRYSSGGRSSYLIPYDGEELKLHWANSDQYYVKTTDNYTAYAFTVGAGSTTRRVRFEIAAADNQRDDIKDPDGKQRRFVPARGGNAIVMEGEDLVIRFEHRPLTEGEKKSYPGNGSTQQSRINEAMVAQVLKAVTDNWQAHLTAADPTETNGGRMLLAKHVERYTAKNSFDYFIHKDLGGFLRRELDLYLKTDVLNLDDLEQGDAARLNRALARVRAVRHIGGKIIDLLAQLEEFQKRLWLKKKFVLETNWCVTLDRVPDEMHAEIATNTAQCDEWVELYTIDEVEGDLTNGNLTWSNPPSTTFLKANPYLVLDTKHFNREFTDRLLASLSDAGPLDEQTDGLLVHGENFQALNLLQARYREQVQCIYIDPPYNTGTDGFLYKDQYKHSSWISMFSDRAKVARQLQSARGVFFFSIDETECARAWQCMEQLYGVENFASEIIWEKKKKPSFLHRNVGKLTDFILAFNKQATSSPPYSVESTTENKLTPLNNAGNQLGVLKFPADSVRFGCEDGTIRAQDMSKGNVVTRLLDDVTIRNGSNDNDFQMEGEWRYSQAKLDEVLQTGEKLYINGVPFRPNHIKPGGKIKKMKNILSPDHYGMETNEDASQQIRDLFGNDAFINPKPERLMRHLVKSVTHGMNDVVVLDYFAGSGTTGHSVINLNREDHCHRKYILVEMADYFDTVLLPRLKKIIYSPDWKSGNPVSRAGSSQLLKYVRLEGYEDTLDSLEVASLSDGQMELLGRNPDLAEDYRLRYALDIETTGSACLLGDELTEPFSYTLSVVRDGARREVQVDLPETFNYLIGLRMESRRRIDGILAITGTDPEGRRCLVLWRNLTEMNHLALDAWFQTHRDQFSESPNIVYVNGDHTLHATREADENWTVKNIEPIFRQLMFEMT